MMRVNRMLTLHSPALCTKSTWSCWCTIMISNLWRLSTKQWQGSFSLLIWSLYPVSVSICMLHCCLKLSSLLTQKLLLPPSSTKPRCCSCWINVIQSLSSSSTNFWSADVLHWYGPLPYLTKNVRKKFVGQQDSSEESFVPIVISVNFVLLLPAFCNDPLDKRFLYMK